MKDLKDKLFEAEAEYEVTADDAKREEMPEESR